jgi:predicted O-methyltransferase YrrM
MTLAEHAAAWVDMAPHIDTLARHASDAQTILELGVRGGVSTWAILDAMPSDGALVSIDIENCAVPERIRADPRWVFVVGDDLSPDVQEQVPPHVDLAFIDTSHEYEHTVAELAWVLTLGPARIVLHDYVMEPVERAATEFCTREGWRLVDNELPFGLATLEPD